MEAETNTLSGLPGRRAAWAGKGCGKGGQVEHARLLQPVAVTAEHGVDIKHNGDFHQGLALAVIRVV